MGITLLNKNFINTFFIASVALISTACSNVEEVNSDDIATSEIWARFAVYSTDNNSSTSEASLLVGGPHSNTYLDLSESDTLQVLLNGSSPQTMVKDPTTSPHNVYHSTYDNTNSGAGGINYRFSFNRTNHPSASNSSVSLPLPVSNIQFNPEESFSRALDNITMSWDPVEDEKISINVKGSCINTYNRNNILDTGILTIAANSLINATESTVNSCPLIFTFTRTKSGAIDKTFGEGGIIEAHSSRTAEIASRP